jgi:hypothetical protein
MVEWLVIVVDPDDWSRSPARRGILLLKQQRNKPMKKAEDKTTEASRLRRPYGAERPAYWLKGGDHVEIIGC